MKYIKLYEDKEFEYKVGDYIHLVEDYIQKKEMMEHLTVYSDVKIIKIINDKIYRYEIRVEAQKKSNNKLKMLWIDLEKIERKSTPEEIEEYNLRKNISKYNL